MAYLWCAVHVDEEHLRADVAAHEKRTCLLGYVAYVETTRDGPEVRAMCP